VQGVAATGSPAADQRDDVWAVGFNEDTGRAVALHFDGQHWQMTVNAPDAGQLVAVSAVAPTDVWAAGAAKADGNGGGTPPFIEHWNGLTWNRIAPPATSWFTGGKRPIMSIAGVGPTSLWMVAGRTCCANFQAQHWDGTSWTGYALPHAPYPHPGGPFIYSPTVTGIAANATRVWVVGTTVRPNDFGATTVTEPYTAVSTGGDFSYVQPAGPLLTSDQSALSAVTIDGTGDAWAAGWRSSIAGRSPLIEHNDGTGWQFSGAAAPADSASLAAVDFASDGTGVAVGTRAAGNSNAPLVERRG